MKCVHFYDNQYDAVKLLLYRNTNTHSNCEVQINNIDFNSDINTIFKQMNIKDFKLVGYSSDEEIKVDMLAPKI